VCGRMNWEVYGGLSNYIGRERHQVKMFSRGWW
jgi:hypothetical protein